MACDSETMLGVTQAHVDCLKAELTSSGATITVTSSVGGSESGSIEGHDVGATYEWLSASGTLVLTITHKPWVVSCDHVIKAVKDALRGCGWTEPSSAAP